MDRPRQDDHIDVTTSAIVRARTRVAAWASAGALGALGALLFAASSQAASQPKAHAAQASSKINACYNNKTGVLRRVGGGGKCRGNETSISWLAAGIAGGGGAGGPMGLQGVRGATGAAGENGVNGVNGPIGP